MAFAGHPVVGDPLYGRSGGANPSGWSASSSTPGGCRFATPGRASALEFADRVPADLAAVLDALAPRSAGRTPAGSRLLAPHGGHADGRTS